MRACLGRLYGCPWHARGPCQTWDTPHAALPRQGLEALLMVEAAYAEVLETPGQVLIEDDEDTDRNTRRLMNSRGDRYPRALCG